MTLCHKDISVSLAAETLRYHVINMSRVHRQLTAREGRDALPPGSISFIFMQFSGNLVK